MKNELDKFAKDMGAGFGETFAYLVSFVMVIGVAALMGKPFPTDDDFAMWAAFFVFAGVFRIFHCLILPIVTLAWSFVKPSKGETDE